MHVAGLAVRHCDSSGGFNWITSVSGSAIRRATAAVLCWVCRQLAVCHPRVYHRSFPAGILSLDWTTCPHKYLIWMTSRVQSDPYFLKQAFSCKLLYKFCSVLEFVHTFFFLIGFVDGQHYVLRLQRDTIRGSGSNDKMSPLWERLREGDHPVQRFPALCWSGTSRLWSMWIDVDECAAGRRYVKTEGGDGPLLCCAQCVRERIKTHCVMLFYMIYHPNRIHP